MTKKKLKTIDEKMQELKLDPFDYAAREALEAYADCHDGLVETRELNFFSKRPLNGKRLIEILAKVIPHGYNAFDADSVKAVVEAFGEHSTYFVAREGSPCIYVRPQDDPKQPGAHVWIGEHGKAACVTDDLADEVSFEPALGMFRLWWD